ncbi:hypothetical protein PM3016_524 [Paenibacillus mucilaginosus 3016]|uniref:Uncharacterized protein n=1 Tax=Paenibacillus mucilaginosus 3016 TaxID=1116391 RepID=H6NSV0_9BACL|nr:hypothetical protein [Paenibacillus mucilaginosus]AFC27491.1 hypothetical protein PM3016_524 [Paenibacillus mucilaginosus 3016]WFA16391.1 hypothetical protein ERY13_02835 [Paenibacillus mucilaginosus]
MVSPFGVMISLLVFLAFPVYVIFRLESISRRLRRMEEKSAGGLRSDLRAYNAQVVEAWERSGQKDDPEPTADLKKDGWRDGER